MKTSDHVHWKLIEGIEDYAILFLDAEGNIVKWNKGACGGDGDTQCYAERAED